FVCVRSVGTFCLVFSCAWHANKPQSIKNRTVRIRDNLHCIAPLRLPWPDSVSVNMFCFRLDAAIIQLCAMKTIDPLRQHVINLLTKAEAHVDLESSLNDFPRELRGRKPEGAPHTPWQLLEHIRIAQWD